MKGKASSKNIHFIIRFHILQASVIMQLTDLPASVLSDAAARQTIAVTGQK